MTGPATIEVSCLVVEKVETASRRDVTFDRTEWFTEGGVDAAPEAAGAGWTSSGERFSLPFDAQQFASFVVGEQYRFSIALVPLVDHGDDES